MDNLLMRNKDTDHKLKQPVGSFSSGSSTDARYECSNFVLWTIYTHISLSEMTKQMWDRPKNFFLMKNPTKNSLNETIDKEYDFIWTWNNELLHCSEVLGEHSGAYNDWSVFKFKVQNCKLNCQTLCSNYIN